VLLCRDVEQVPCRVDLTPLLVVGSQL
jgi:hypothetical protein